jgi:hypothetical protein
VQVGQEDLLTPAGPSLLAECLRRFGAARLRVGGTSMLPAIRPRDVLVIEPRPLQQIRVSDIVLFTLGDRLFVHRVVRKGTDESGAPTLVTRGDTHREDDLPISASQLLGQVVAVWRGRRRHHAPFPYSRTASMLSLAAVRCLYWWRAGRGRQQVARATTINAPIAVAVPSST